jgi:succinoglycan biosynthesis protein ExoU
MAVSVPPGSGSVDVLVAAWNRADTIGRAVSSALAQPEVQNVLVVDDGSTDDTVARATDAGAGSGRVTVLALQSNSGPSAARNRAIEASTASWLSILDGDDYLLPGRIGAMLSAADGWDIVADDIFVEQARPGAEVELRPMMFAAQFEPFQLDFAEFVLGNSGRRGQSRKEFGYFKPLIRRSFLDRFGLRYDESMRLGEDYALYANALARGARCLVMPASGYVSVVRPDSLSAKHSKRDLELLRDTDLELCKLPTLSAYDRRALRAHYRSVDARVQWAEMVEALKARSPIRSLRPFGRSFQVTTFLLQKLAIEMTSRIKRSPRSATGS